MVPCASLAIGLLCLCACLGPAATASAQADKAEPAAPSTQSPAPAAADQPAVDTGNNAWVLTSSGLVLMMTGPGLALFYCGLVRKKNVLSVMMQCVFLMGLMSVIWALWGYTLAFGG